MEEYNKKHYYEGRYDEDITADIEQDLDDERLKAVPGIKNYLLIQNVFAIATGMGLVALAMTERYLVFLGFGISALGILTFTMSNLNSRFEEQDQLLNDVIYYKWKHWVPNKYDRPTFVALRDSIEEYRNSQEPEKFSKEKLEQKLEKKLEEFG